MSVFDSRAGDWDKKSRRVKLASDVVNSIIKYADPGKDLKLADFGTGTGLIMLGLSEYASEMIGYDSSEGMLQKLAEKAADAGLKNISAELFDLENDSFPAEQFDMMTCSMVAHHLDHPEVFFCKAYDSLKDGGKLCVADLEKSEIPFHEVPSDSVKHEGFDAEWLEESMKNCGFSDVQIYRAAVIEKERDGERLEFGVFLAVAEK